MDLVEHQALRVKIYLSTRLDGVRESSSLSLAAWPVVRGSRWEGDGKSRADENERGKGGWGARGTFPRIFNCTNFSQQSFCKNYL